MTKLSHNPRYVIIDPAFLGDIVFNGPLVRSIRSKHPHALINLVVRPPFEKVAEMIAGVDGVHSFDKRGADSGWSGIKRMAAQLRAEEFDCALIPHPSIRSALLAYLAGIPSRIGLGTGLSKLFLNQSVAIESSDSFVQHRLGLFTAVGVSTSLAGTIEPPDGPLSRSTKKRVGLCLGSVWETKRWPSLQAKKFLSDLDSSKYEVLFLGAPWERQLFEDLDDLGIETIDGTDSTLEQMVQQIASCDVVIAGDTGPLQIARALSIPVVALFGPSHESRHEFEDIDVVLTENVSCRPCSPHGHRACPLKHHACMQDLDGKRVHGAVLKVVNS